MCAREGGAAGKEGEQKVDDAPVNGITMVARIRHGDRPSKSIVEITSEMSVSVSLSTS